MKHKAPKLSPHILDEAANWFVDFGQGDIDAAGREKFNAWLRRSPEHVRAYLQIAALWEDAALLKEGRTLVSEELVARALRETNVVHLGEAAPAELPPREPSGPDVMRVEKTYRRNHNFAIAACVLLALAGTWLYIQRGTYATSIGEQRSIVLTDGSTVDLNSRSKVRIRYTDNERDVELIEGQALFRVAKDHSRPFIVQANGTRVRAVGTQFDVYRKTVGTTVTVVEGRVAILSGSAEISDAAQGSTAVRSGVPRVGATPPGDINSHETPDTRTASSQIDAALRSGLSGAAILLAAGEQITVTPTAVAAPKPADISAATAWTRREIVFHATPLSDVIEEFNRYNDRQLTIVDAGLKDTRISGVFSSTDPESLLRFLKELPNIRIEESRSQIRIRENAGQSP